MLCQSCQALSYGWRSVAAMLICRPMAIPFPIIGVLGRETDPRVSQTLSALAPIASGAGCRLLVDDRLPLPAGQPGFTVVGREELLSCARLLVVVGGDGTMLKAAHALAGRPLPVVGVNLGRLGFLTDIAAENLHEDLAAILHGDCSIEMRLLLEAEIVGGGAGSQRCAPALNDVVIQKADGGRLIEFEARVDGQLLGAYRADGIIAATPTGSTAYALSGGGPILHPSLEAVTLVPICPHTLGDRPIVIKADSLIEITLTSTHGGRAQLTCDGQDYHALAPGQGVRIRRAAQPIRFAHPRGYDYYRILRTKLHWGSTRQGREE